MARIVSLVVLVGIVLVAAVLSYRVMASFLLPMFLAVLLGVMFQPLHRWFIARVNGRIRVAAGLTTVAILLIVLLPTVLIVGLAASEAYSLATNVDQQQVGQKLTQLRRQFGLELPPAHVEGDLQQFQSTLDELRAGEALVPLPGQPQQTESVQSLMAMSRNLRDALDLRRLPPPAKGFTFDDPERRWAALEALDTQLAALVKIKPDTPEFAQHLTATQQAFVEFRTAALGGPLVLWMRHQVNPDEDQKAAIIARAKELAGPVALGTGQFFGSFIGNVLVGLGVMIISLYYFLADGPSMVRAAMRLSPLDDRYEEQLLHEFATLSRAVVVATLLSAFAQGLLASLGYFFTGFESVFLLTVLTMFLAMIPFVGAASVWGCCCLWLLFYEGRPGAALGLALYGALVVSMIDNLIKPLVLQGQSNLHPLLALLSVLGGVKALGPIGIFVGPMVVAFLQALLNMLHMELLTLDGSPRVPVKARGKLNKPKPQPE